jgi:predicted RNA methylase
MLANTPIDLPATLPKSNNNLIDLQAIEHFSRMMAAGKRFEQKEVIAVMDECCGGSATEGLWHWKRAYDLIEGAFAHFLMENRDFSDFDSLQGFVPHQTARSQKSVEMQQFSTPLAIANIVAVAAQLNLADTVLEPSAGTGILASFAARVTPRLFLNELDSDRAGILKYLFPGLPIHSYNAESIDDYLELATSHRPSVAIMNPPFSSSPNMAKRNRQAVFNHIRSALDRLADFGRLVAIVPHWFNPETCPAFKQYGAQLRLSAFIPGKVYRYHATTMETRLIVLDKIENAGPIGSIDVPFEELLAIVQGLPPRQMMPANHLASPAKCAGKEEIAQLFLVPPVERQVVRAKSLIAMPLAGFQDAILLIYEAAVPTTSQASDAEGIYESYRSSVVHIPGAIEHPTPLVESLAMASVQMPMPSYQPLLPVALIERGILSHAQLEAVIYAGEAHAKLLDAHWYFDPETKEIRRVGADAGVAYRRGFWIGDGTGVGKGRECSAILCDNWMQGRRKGLWLSKNPTLLEDARRDWQSLGGNPDRIIPIGKYKQGETIGLSEGILFVPYGTLRVGAKQGKCSRLDQIITWLGEDFDGCINFDEAHLMGNACGEEGGRGKKAASQQGLAGLELQNRLPKARIVYISATGASKVSNLAYATRLGLWSTNHFPFANREEFISQMENSGIAAMEVVIRDLKATGLYMARALSYDGISYQTLVHDLTPAQVEIYDTYARVFKVIHQNIDKALTATKAVSEGGKCRNSASKSAARSAFYGTVQRFFNHLVTAAKFPSVVDAIEADLQADHAAIVQIVSTDEALLERKLADTTSDQWANLRLDFTPKEAIVDYLLGSFPVQLQEVYTDPEGREYSQLVTDGVGNPIMCKAAVAMRDALIEDIALLPSVAGFLDQLVWHFGSEVVAEVTGRSKRVILEDGKYRLESRPSNANIAETQSFQDDRKRILVFSAAGGTGRSYHADRNVANQRLRRHYLVQSGWEASNAVQSLGRSHRSNQTQPPTFILTTTNVKGEMRFTATIASRLESLGALTRGQRQTGSQGVYNDEIGNLTSDYAKTTLIEFFQKLSRNGVPGYSIGQFAEMTGLNLLCEDGGLREDLPPINTFLNRLLALKIADQNNLFDVFEKMLKQRIEAAKEGGYYEIGVERLVADGGFNVVGKQVLATHPGGSETICYEVEQFTRPNLVTTSSAQRLVQGSSYICYVNTLGDTAVMKVWDECTDRDGSVFNRCQLVEPAKSQTIEDYKIPKLGWTETSSSVAFWESWEQEVRVTPEFLSVKLHLICGLLLPVWDKLPNHHSKVNRLITNDGTVLLGRAVAKKELQKIHANFGVKDRPVALSASEIYQMVWHDRQVVKAGKCSLGRSYWKGNEYLEILDVSGRGNIEYLKTLGCETEIISFKMRVFVPVNDQVLEVIEKLQSY